MRLLLAIDMYVPARISGAVQMHDFARELIAQGHRPTVLVPGPALGGPWRIDDVDGVEVLRVGAPRTKDVGLVRRAIGECLMPWALYRGLRASPLRDVRWDGVVWYSPTIFLGPLVALVKRHSGCRGYLILRDLFPDWAVDAGVLRRGLAYRFFKAVERFQYRVADVIGVQTPANLPLVARDCVRSRARLEVLNNWLSDSDGGGSTALDLGRGPLAQRTIFAYTGNMGAAQGMDCLVDLAVAMREERSIGFLFVGRGSDVLRLQARVERERLDNVMFVDEVAPSDIPAILRQCHVGMLALDPSHTTHNIPGKFVAYLRAGLPVLARINPGNDLHRVIEDEDVGRSCAGDAGAALHTYALELAKCQKTRARMGRNGVALADRVYSSHGAVRQVVNALRH